MHVKIHSRQLGLVYGSRLYVCCCCFRRCNSIFPHVIRNNFHSFFGKWFLCWSIFFASFFFTRTRSLFISTSVFTRLCVYGVRCTLYTYVYGKRPTMIFDISLRCLLVDLNLKYAFFNLFIVSKRGSCVSVNRTFVCTFHVHYACMQIHLNQYRLRWTITIQCTIQLFMCLWRFSFSILSFDA